MTAGDREPIPVTGAWRPGDPPGRRQFVTLFEDRPLLLRAGGSLSPITVAYETWGELNADASNAVLVCHALTGDSHAAGPVEPGHSQLGWWNALIGPGRAIDTDRFYVVCPNVLAGCQGTTGPSSQDPETNRPYGSRFPVTTIRDQVDVEAALGGALGIERWSAVLGGSMGGQRALEWTVKFPEHVERAVIIACGAAATAEQIALCSLQIHAIEDDPHFHHGDYYNLVEGPWRGMCIARGIGQVSYRSELELQQRFERGHQNDEHPFEGGLYTVESYLEYHGEKLLHRFDANSYIALSRAMNHHDVGRGRGGVRDALARVQAEVTIAGISTDRLYPLRLQYELADLIPRNKGVDIIHSIAGHDGFLTEHEAIGQLIAGALAEAANVSEFATASDGARIAYETQGDGPALVLVHGNSECRQSWDPLVDALATDHRVVTVDLRGHGESERKPAYDPLTMAVDLDAVVRAADIREPLVVGHSLGGVVVTMYAAGFPVRGVINIDQPLELGEFQALLAPVAPLLRGDTATFEAVMQDIFAMFFGPLPDDERARIVALAHPEQDVVLGIWGPVLDVPAEVLDALMSEALVTITAPYLSLHGSDPGTEYEGWLTARIKTARVELWPGDAHYLHLLEPDRFLARLRAFER